MLSIVEVAFGAQEKAQRALDEEAEFCIDRRWPPDGRPIALVEPSVAVMRRAREVVSSAMTGGRRLQAVDTIYLVTADVIVIAASVIGTYEDASRRAAWSELTGITVEEPSVDQEPPVKHDTGRCRFSMPACWVLASHGTPADVAG